MHALPALLVGGGMIITYPRSPYPQNWGGSFSWFVTVGVICALIGFGTMTLLDLL